jgi:hypothetical protein
MPVMKGRTMLQRKVLGAVAAAAAALAFGLPALAQPASADISALRGGGKTFVGPADDAFFVDLG